MTQFVWSLYFCTADLFDASFIFTFSIFGYCTIFKSIFELLPILQLFVFLRLVVVVFFFPFFDPISVFVSVVFFIILISFFGSFMRMTLCDKPNEIDGASAERRKNLQQNVCWWFLLVILLLLLILFFIISALCTNSIDESFKRIAVLSRYTNFFFSPAILSISVFCLAFFGYILLYVLLMVSTSLR